MKYLHFVLFIAAGLALASCDKSVQSNYQFYQVGVRSSQPGKAGDTSTIHWKDTSFVVATSNPQLISQINTELSLPEESRKIVIGPLGWGSGGYNRNGPHHFKWHLRANEWSLADVSAEIYDGRPHADVDRNIRYWKDTVQAFGPWDYVIKRQLD